MDARVTEIAKVLRNCKGQVIDRGLGYVKVRKFDAIIEARVRGCDIDITLTTNKRVYSFTVENGVQKILESVKSSKVFVDPVNNQWVFESELWNGNKTTTTLPINEPLVSFNGDEVHYIETDGYKSRKMLKYLSPSFYPTGILEDLLGQRALRILAWQLRDGVHLTPNEDMLLNIETQNTKTSRLAKLFTALLFWR